MIASPQKNTAKNPPDVQSLTLQIDGQDVSCRAGETILQVARENNIDIPTLCQLDGLSISGGCRLCIVEVTGSNKLLAACSTQCAEGMQVTTTSPRLQAYRRMIIEMLLCERNHVCAVCVSNGHCELQTLAQKGAAGFVQMPGGPGRFNPEGLGSGQNPGERVDVPDRPDADGLAQRTRAILEELRRRASERNRPTEEQEYLRRLMKEF